MTTSARTAHEWTVIQMFNWMNRAWKQARFGIYPACEHLNCALGWLLDDAEKNREAIEEICYAITKANGYFYGYIANSLVMYGFGRFVSKENVCD